MKANIISYLQTYGQESFQQRAFNGVDALILCQFSYLKFDGIIPGLPQAMGKSVTALQTEALAHAFSEDTGQSGMEKDEGTGQSGMEKDEDTGQSGMKEGLPMVTLLDIWRSPNRERMFYDIRFEEENRALAEQLLLSARFKHAHFGLFADFVSAEEKVQFSALTCVLEDGSVKIIYRGTDESLAGWREDMDMALTYPVPGQEYSSRYLELAAGFLTGPLDILGHSKGGNLAVYAAMNASNEVQARINTIYNMDGPGFKKGVCQLELFERIEPKIQKFIPRSSLVGMILENYGDYRVVDSDAVGMMQHFPSSWTVEGTDFAYLEKLDEPQRIINDAVREWLERLSEEEQREFVDTLFEVLEASGVSDLVEFTRDYKGCISRMLTALQNQDPDKRKRALRVVRLLFQISGQPFKSEALAWIQEKLEK
ncbi:MAG: DUF2974 domain-containing protein [Lachnospiraceae bacterium]|nr:DUF2974 domain-containing protein [Lachnospiraceae bacterium]